MSPIRIIVFILVIGWSLAQTLPQPIKSQIALGASSEREMIVTAVVVRHLPNTDKIAAAWQVRNLNQNSSLAYIRGAVASTSGDILKQLDVSTDTTLGFQLPSGPLLVALTDGGFAIFYYNGLAGNYYYMRRYDSDLNPVSEPVLVAIPYKCIQPTAAIDTNGDIIVGCPRYFSPNFLVYRINSTGHILNSLQYPVNYQNVHPSLALSGDNIAISMIRVVNKDLLDLRLYFIVLDKNFNVLQEFTPFVNTTLILTASTTGTVTEPGTFSAIAMGVDEISYFLYTVKFNSTSIVTQYSAAIPTYLQSIGTSLNADGEGLLYCSTISPSTYMTFPLAQIDGDQVFAMNQSDFHAVHSISTAEASIDTVPQFDLVNSVTTWPTGGAVAWPEISLTTGIHYARITIYGTYCGDSFTEGSEQCDGGVDCRSDCTCPAGQISDTRSGCMSQPVAAAPRTSTTPPTPTPVNQPVATSSSGRVNLSVLLQVFVVLIIVFVL